MADVTKRPIGTVKFDDYLLLQGKNAGLGDEHRARVTDVVNALGAKSSLVKVATFGDSYANVVTAGTSNTLGSAIYQAVLPASGVTTQIQLDGARLPFGRQYPAARLVANGGVGGETTTQMLARSSAGAGATRKAIEDIIASQPDIIIVRGGINNSASVTVANLAATVATAVANMRLILDRLAMSGAVILMEGLYGYSGTLAPDPASRRAFCLQFNAAMQAHCAANGYEYQSWLGLLHDENANVYPAVLADDVHLNKAGGEILSRVEAEIMTLLFGTSKPFQFPGTNLAPNPLLSAFSTVGHGNVATGYSAEGSNVTRSNAKIETINGITYQTCEFLINGASAGPTIQVPLSGASLPGVFVAGETYGLEFDYLIDILSGGPLIPTNIRPWLDLTKTGAGRWLIDVWGTVNQSPVSQLSGHFALGPFTIDTNSADLAAASKIQLNLNTSAVGAVIKLGMGNLRIVKLS